MDKEMLAAWLAEGCSLEEIGRRVERHPSTVSYWLRKYGLEAANRAVHLAKGGVDRETLVRLVDEGASIRQIAAELELSATAVRHWLDRYGLATRRGVTRREAAKQRENGHAEYVELTCARHGVTRFKRRVSGGYRCLRCRSEAVVRRRRKVKEILVREAGGSCKLCGYDVFPGALHFHHLDPAAKSFILSRQGVTRSLAESQEEARKCILLCANCHAEVEAGIVTLP
jgi:transposase